MSHRQIMPPHLTPTTPEQLAPFWERVDKRGTDECWPWLGSRLPRGYGTFSVRGRNYYAHRIAYEALIGPIPEELQIDHLCRNPWCVNPAHMEPVTARENTLRGNSRSAQNARKIRCDAGHPLTGANLGMYGDGVRRCKRCHADREAERRGRTRAYRSPLALTPATPEALALYRSEHVIVPQAGKNVSGRDCQVCAVDGIELMRKGFYGFLHSTDAIRRLVRIERGQPEYLEGEWRPAEAWTVVPAHESCDHYANDGRTCLRCGAVRPSESAWTPEEILQIAAQTPGMEIRRG